MPAVCAIREYASVCSDDSLAVVWPVTPLAIRPASSSATLRPVAATSHAVESPAMPAPRTATSTSTSSVIEG